jgi:hypothetical protein
MTRTLLALGLCALTLALGLWAALIQCDNHARARDLAELQRQCEMIEAANAQAQALVSSHVPGRANRVAKPSSKPSERAPEVHE